MVFALCQLIKKCGEQLQQLHNLVKAFDSVNRSLIWNLKIGILSKLVNIIRGFHEGMAARISISGELTEPLQVSFDQRQGCILAPALFILFFLFVLCTAQLSLPDLAIDISHKQNGKLFNLYCIKTKPATMTKLVTLSMLTT